MDFIGEKGFSLGGLQLETHLLWVKRLFASKRPPGAAAAAPLLVPLLFLCSLSLLFILTPLDARVQSLFYDPAVGWHLSDAWPFRLAYDSGELPAVVLSVAALLFAGSSVCIRRASRWRRPALFVTLAMLLGPGLLVNSVFKDHMGRPRPLHTTEFGGDLPYHQLGVVGFPGQYKSFPSGHASMGFFFCNLYFVWRASRRRLAQLMLTLGLLLGCWIGLARIAQGAHWASDILWSFGVVYLCGYLLSRLMLSPPPALASSVSLRPTARVDLEQCIPVSSGAATAELFLDERGRELGAANSIRIERKQRPLAPQGHLLGTTDG